MSFNESARVFVRNFVAKFQRTFARTKDEIRQISLSLLLQSTTTTTTTTIVSSRCPWTIVSRISLAYAGELSSRRVFSANVPPKCNLPVSLDVLYHWGEKLNYKFANLKGRKRFLLHVPYRRKQPSRRFRMNKRRSTPVNLPSNSPQADFFSWCIFRFVLFS